MDSFFQDIAKINTITGAKQKLYSIFEAKAEIEKAVEFCIEAHQGQSRKSGEPYAVHPLLVACIVADYGGNKETVIAALLHDVVEDTPFTQEQVRVEYGEIVSNFVEGLTKIDEIRGYELAPSDSDEKLVKSALSFRKMLLASIRDIEVLVIKLCDRVHNMLTLSVLPPNKQKRIAEETLVVYAPIANRLGIAKLKNILEDLAFSYIFPQDYKRVSDYVYQNYLSIQLKLNTFIETLEQTLLKNGFIKKNIEIKSRIKHAYSIYMKMQRKGVSIEEVLDLLAVRILVESPLECYKAFGIVHQSFKPLVSRFKDYIALPKENGYQTLHTTVFHDSSIFEIQIRTFDMDKSADFGVAAHWKYKSKGLDPNLEWLHNIQYENVPVTNFYEDTKSEFLSGENITVYSPKGTAYSLPRGSIALDFAYAIHTEIGDKAAYAIINQKRCSLLSILRHGEIVTIETAEKPILRCSWIDTLKSSKAKTQVRLNCKHRIKELNREIGLNILRTIFLKSAKILEPIVETEHIKLHKLPVDMELLEEATTKIRTVLQTKNKSHFKKLKEKISGEYRFKEYTFDNITLYSNVKINMQDIGFDYCCHPKRGDAIVAFWEKGRVEIHHKLCDKAMESIKKRKNMLFVDWVQSDVTRYAVTFSLENVIGALVKFLQFLADNGINITLIELGNSSEGYARNGKLHIETTIKDLNIVKSKLEIKVKVIEIKYLGDSYKS